MSFEHPYTYCVACGQDALDLESIEGNKTIYECYNCGSIHYSCVIGGLEFKCSCLYYDATTNQFDDICIGMGRDYMDGMPFYETDLDSFGEE